MPVQKYKTTPNFIPVHSLEIEALQHIGGRNSNRNEMRDFHPQVSGAFGSPAIFIYTATGPTQANPGDWVIKDGDKFFVCGDAQFQTMYTLAE